ncbi:hypothetical protein WDZ92_04810, partial [Nostoc sp. NIES-2111]
KTEKPIIKSKEIPQEVKQENLQTETSNISELKPEEKSLNIDNQEISYVPNYIPAHDYPLIQSVGNSGWQVSDIWRDLRVDNFCDS